MSSRWILACVLLLVAAPAEAQELSDRSPRIAVNLALGFAGELDTDTDGLSGESDLDPSIGFDLRGELPVLDFLVIGAWFELLSVEPDVSGLDREETFSFDAFVRVRWVFEIIDRTLFVEPYAMLPVGFTLAVLPELDGGDDDDVYPGWNIGVLFGAQLLHASGAGGYLEIGWRHIEVYGDDVTVLDRDVSHTLNEMAFNLGFVYAFGS